MIAAWLASTTWADPCRDADQADARGLAQWKRGERAEARATWEAAYGVPLYASCPATADELCTNLGYARLEDGRLLDAWRWLGSCGDGPTTLLNLGDASAGLGWADDARDAYTRALQNGLQGRQAERATAALARLGPALPAGPPVACTDVRGEGSDVLATCGGRGWRSSDGGLSWAPSAIAPTRAPFPGLPADARTLAIDGRWFAVVGGRDEEHAGVAVLLRSDDRGATWTKVKTFALAYSTVASALGGDRGLLLVGGVERQGMGGGDWLARSLDGGATWAPVAKDPTSVDATDSCAWTGAWADGDRASIVGDEPACAPQYSVDRGATFHLARAMPKGLLDGASALWASGGAVWAAGPGGLFASVDGGATWVDRTPR